MKKFPEFFYRLCHFEALVRNLVLCGGFFTTRCSVQNDNTLWEKGCHDDNVIPSEGDSPTRNPMRNIRLMGYFSELCASEWQCATRVVFGRDSSSLAVVRMTLFVIPNRSRKTRVRNFYRFLDWYSSFHRHSNVIPNACEESQFYLGVRFFLPYSRQNDIVFVVPKRQRGISIGFIGNKKGRPKSERPFFI